MRSRCSCRRAMAGAARRATRTWLALSPPLGNRRFRLLRAGDVLDARARFKPDVVIERYYNFGGEGVRAARKVGALRRSRSERADCRSPGIDEAPARSGTYRRTDATMARLAMPAVPTSSSHPARVSCPATFLHRRSSRRSGAPIRIAFVPAPGARCRSLARWRRRDRGIFRCVSRMARRDPSCRRDSAPARARTDTISRLFSLATDRNCLAYVRRRRMWTASDSPAPCPMPVPAHPRGRRCWRRAIRRLCASVACARVSLVAAENFRVHGVGAAGRRAAYRAARRHRRRWTRRRCSMTRGSPDGLARALERLTDASLRRRMGVAARQRAVTDFSWESHCRRLDRAIRAVIAHADSDRQRTEVIDR